VSTPELERLLRAKDIRPTQQRLAVLAELSDEPNDATAQTLWQRLRDQGNRAIGLATVSRTLALLSDRGVIDSLSHHAKERCYRLCSDRHHHHLVCEGCHRVVELERCDLGDWARRTARKHGFVARGHQLELRGLCPACR
jgi:Fur family ferric uptake transcriptional regulator